MESRDSRLATLVAEKQRLTEEAEQRQREVRLTAAPARWSYVCVESAAGASKQQDWAALLGQQALALHWQ